MENTGSVARLMSAKEAAIGRRRLYDKVVIDRYLDRKIQEVK